MKVRIVKYFLLMIFSITASDRQKRGNFIELSGAKGKRGFEKYKTLRDHELEFYCYAAQNTIREKNEKIRQEDDLNSKMYKFIKTMIRDSEQLNQEVKSKNNDIEQLRKEIKSKNNDIEQLIKDRASVGLKRYTLEKKLQNPDGYYEALVRKAEENANDFGKRLAFMKIERDRLLQIVQECQCKNTYAKIQ